MPSNRRAGTIYFRIGGETYDAKGSFTYNIGGETRETIVGADRIHGFKSMPRPASVEGVVTDSDTVDLAALQAIEDTTVTLELQNGKVIVIRNAWFAGEGDVTTEEGEIAVRFEGLSGEELREQAAP